MSRRVLLPCALLALSVLLPCFVGNSGNGSHGRALRMLREGTAAPKATTETPKPKEAPKETPKAETPKAETPKSVALVQVTKENTIATASVLGGLTGLLLGGFWIGAAGFVATSYLAKKEDDDVSTVLKGVSSASLEALNFVDYLNQKYEVSGQVGAALSDALDTSEGETSSSVKSALGTVNGAIDSFDKDIGIRETLGGLVLAGSDLANQLATKVVELNTEYKVTDQLKSKIDEAMDKSKSQA
mmetsp:Transcript_75202/g.119424  ORF Transcript_75202/g.119424 Transcript_75202/m.119424 type:complete len:244 (-) Transcript_75202:239-970(-)